MGKPTIPEVLPLMYAYRDKEGNSVGGNFHIVLDECNVDNGSVLFCLERAREAGDADGIALGEALLQMSKTQRSKLSDLFYTSQREAGDERS